MSEPQWSKSAYEAKLSMKVVPSGNQTHYFSGSNNKEVTIPKEWKMRFDRDTGKMGLFYFPLCEICVDKVSWRQAAYSNTFRDVDGCGAVKVDDDKKDWIEIPINNDVMLTAGWQFSLSVTYRIAEKALSPLPPLDTLSSDFEKQFLSPVSSDVAFEIGEEAIPAHKIILIARVPAFERMFATEMEESRTNRIRIDDCDAASFKYVLKFIYCGKFPEELADVADSILPITEKYGIQDLKDACANAIKSVLQKDNIIPTLILAYLYRCPNLMEECLRHMMQLKGSFQKEDYNALKMYPDLMIEVISHSLS